MSITYQYKFKLDIGSWTTPIVGNGYVEANPLYNTSGLDSSLQDNEIFFRTKFNGTLEFHGDQWDVLNTLKANYKKIDIKIYRDSLEIAEGNLNMLGMWDNDNKVCKLKVEILDEYSDIIENYSTIYNVLQANPILKCRVFNERNYEYLSDTIQTTLNLTVYSSVNFDIPHSGDNATTNPTAVGSPPDATWGFYRVNYTCTKINTPVFPIYPLDFDIDRTFIREILYVPYLGTEYNEPDATYTYIEDVTIGGKSFRKYGRPPQTDTWVNSGMQTKKFLLIDYYIHWINNSNTYTDTLYLDYPNCRLLQDVIEYIVGEIDSSILFDSDSFTYLENNIDLTNVMISGISDIVLNESGQVESDQSTLLNMSFEQLFNYLKQAWKLYWELEEISGSYYFRIKHRSEVLYTLGAEPGNDLTDFKGKNWTRGKSNYQYKGEKYSRTKRNAIGLNADFLGTDIIIPSLENVIPNTQEITYGEFFTDIWDIQNNGQRYPDNIDKFVALSTERLDTTDKTTQAVNKSWDSFTSYTGSNLGSFDATKSTAGRKYSINDYGAVSSGDVIKLSFNCVFLGGSKLYVVVISDENDLTFSKISQTETTNLTGDNEMYLRIDEDSATSYIAFWSSMTDNVNVKVRDVDMRNYNFQLREETGALTGLDVANAELSIANLDAGHGQYEIEGTPALINLVSTPLTDIQLDKDRQQQEIDVPLHLNEIDVKSLVKTDLSEIEPTKIQIFFNKKFSIITGKL